MNKDQTGNQHFHTRDTFLINTLSNVVRDVVGEEINIQTYPILDTSNTILRLTAISKHTYCTMQNKE